MIKITNYRQLHDVDNQEQGIAIIGTCLSTDTKPLEYAGGSMLIETDHKEGFWVWMFDEASMTWILQSKWGGSIKECECPPVEDIISQTLAKLPIASRTKLGILQINDMGFNIDDGLLSLNYDYLNTKFKPELTDEDIQNIINQLKDYIDNTVKNMIKEYVDEVIQNMMDEIINKILANLPVATETQKGIMQIGTGLKGDGNGLVSLDETYTNTLIDNGITSYVSNNYETIKAAIAQYTIDNIPKADANTYGLVKIGDNIKVDNGVISVPFATKTSAGVVQVGDNISVEDNTGVISVAEAKPGQGGVINMGDTFVYNSVTNTYDMPIATATTVGVVKAGTNVTIDADGSLNCTASGGSGSGSDYVLPLMTTTVRGGAKLRDGTTEGDVQLSSSEGMYVDLTTINDRISSLEEQAATLNTTTTE